MNYAEQDCTIHHEGYTFTANGAFVSEDRLAAYLAHGSEERVGQVYPITDWHGRTIGQVTITGRWHIPNGVFSSHMISGRAVVNGVAYNVRGGGAGMALVGKRAKVQP